MRRTTSSSLGGLGAALVRVAAAATTPLLPDDYLDLVAPLRRGTHRARLLAVVPETSSSATLVLRPSAGWTAHAPGQNVRLGVDVDGVRLWRSYSLTSPVRPDGSITVTVSVVPDGAVSTHLVRAAEVGDVVELEGPDGDFVLSSPLPQRALFVTAGSGITPVIGMLRASLAGLDDVVVVHSARTADDVLFGRELRAWASDGRIRLVERHTAADGRLTTDELEQLVPDLADRETWACGPNGLVDAVVGLFEDRGWSHRLHVERFRPVAAVLGGGGSVTFARTGATVDADGSRPLLVEGEDAGVLLRSGCRMGICYGCVVPLEEGAVRDVRDGAITVAAPGDGVLIQTCINAPAGPCVIDA
jgi:ferredoxin-NADP reductase